MIRLWAISQSPTSGLEFLVCWLQPFPLTWIYSWQTGLKTEPICCHKKYPCKFSAYNSSQKKKNFVLEPTCDLYSMGLLCTFNPRSRFLLLRFYKTWYQMSHRHLYTVETITTSVGVPPVLCYGLSIDEKSQLEQKSQSVKSRLLMIQVLAAFISFIW